MWGSLLEHCIWTFVFCTSILTLVLLCSLTVPPESDETMRLDFTIVSLPGNPINLTNFITIKPSEVYYTASNWSTEIVLLVDGTSERPLSSAALTGHGAGIRMLHVIGLLYVQMVKFRSWDCSAPRTLAGRRDGLQSQCFTCVAVVHTDKLRVPGE